MTAPAPGVVGDAPDSAGRPEAPLLPRLLVLADSSATGGRPLPEVVAAAVTGGARAVVLRDKDLGRQARAELAARLRDLLVPVSGLLLVASDAELAAEVGADGVHLATRDPRPGRHPALIGRSCHDAGEVRRAAAEGCHYVTLSPIHPTPSKPGYGPALGPGALAGHALPVWALGGVDAANAPACLAAGAAGVAVMGTVMGAADPEGAARKLCRAIGGEW